MKDNHTPADRDDMAEALREILATLTPRDYARAFCNAVLSNYRTGLWCIPRRAADGQWHPKRRRWYDAYRRRATKSA